MSRNILCGDARSLKDANNQPIVFSEWAFVKGSFIKRKDYVFKEIIPNENDDLFGAQLIEETGKLDEVLLKLSRYFESASEQAVKNLTTAFEPMIMVILGLGVGVLLMAIILPIYNITENFQ